MCDDFNAASSQNDILDDFLRRAARQILNPDLRRMFGPMLLSDMTAEQKLAAMRDAKLVINQDDEALTDFAALARVVASHKLAAADELQRVL